MRRKRGKLKRRRESAEQAQAQEKGNRNRRCTRANEEGRFCASVEV